MAQAILWIPERDAPQTPAPRSRRRAWTFDKNGVKQPVVDDLGNPVVERLPAIGHTGPVNNAIPMRGVRAIEFLRFDGHLIASPVTGAAAAVAGTDRSHEQSIRAKARYHGWIERGVCPVDAAMTDLIKPQRLVSDECREALKKGDRCQRRRVDEAPCKHWIAEEAARKARNAKADAARAEAAKSEATRSADQQTKALFALAEKMAEKAAAK